MPVLAGSGTQTAVINTEHTLFDSVAAGTYQLHVDPNALAAGDAVELRVYAFVLTGGTRRVVQFTRYTGVQPVDDMYKVSIPFSTDLTDSGAVRFTLKQTKGTGRNFPWKVVRFA